MPDPASASEVNPYPPPAGALERPREDAARTAGRGGVAIAVAKVSFILFGFAQQVILPRVVGVGGYGEVSRVLAVAGIVNNVIVAVGIQGVSRVVSAAPDGQAAEAFRRTLRVHVVLAMAVSLCFALAAARVADWIEAPHVASPLRLVALVVLLYGIYAPLVGSLNGRRRFFDQAGLDIGYGMLRTIGVVGAALLFLRAGGSGVVGAIAGFVCAAGLIVPIALTRSGFGRSGQGGPTLGGYLSFIGPLAFGQVFLNLLLQTDFLLVSSFLGKAGSRNAADELVGVYRGVQLFSFLPYQLLMSITFILFPMLARAHAAGDGDAVKRYTSTGVRLAFLMTGLMCGAVSALAPHVLRFAFQEPIWSQGGNVLRVHSLGMGAFSILGITCAALTSLGRERLAAMVTMGTVGLVAAACTWAAPLARFGPEMLLHAAAAAAGALVFATVIAAVVLRRAAGAFVPAATPIRVLVALGGAIALGWQLPWLGKIGVIAEVALVAAAYLGVLVALREIGRHDLAAFRAAFGRRS